MHHIPKGTWKARAGGPLCSAEARGCQRGPLSNSPQLGSVVLHTGEHWLLRWQKLDLTEKCPIGKRVKMLRKIRLFWRQGIQRKQAALDGEVSGEKSRGLRGRLGVNIWGLLKVSGHPFRGKGVLLSMSWATCLPDAPLLGQTLVLSPWRLTLGLTVTTGLKASGRVLPGSIGISPRRGNRQHSQLTAFLGQLRKDTKAPGMSRIRGSQIQLGRRV